MMSKRKYTKGRQITSLDDFCKCPSDWFVVCYGGGNCHQKTTHRSWLISMQFRQLASIVEAGWVYVADKIEEANNE